jgi:uncharacterized membrane protein (UPF0127 family)
VRALNRDRGTELARRVEKADSFWKRLRGLGGRREFPPGQALWIIPCRGVHTRGMRFPIDVLFLDSARRVLAMEKNLAPGRFPAVRWRARTVLELPAGTLHGSDTRIGDHIQFEMPEET